MIVTVEELNHYSGNHDDSTEATNLKEIYLGSAEELVTNYLGYNPLYHLQEDVLCGLGYVELIPKAYPIRHLESLTIDGTEMDLADYYTDGDCIMHVDEALFPAGVNNIHLTYYAGYDNDEIPNAIKSAILQIATLKLVESNGNIGLTGKSFSDNSRTFINYSNYDKYLKPLDGLRVIHG